MKRLALLLFAKCILNFSLLANPTYIVGQFNVFASTDKPLKTEGVNRFGVKEDTFFFTNLERDYIIELDHLLYENGTNNPVVLDLPIAELENLENIIKAEDLLKFETAGKAYSWMLDMLKNNVKIYIIDINDYYKSDPALEKPDRMKVIEVRISYQSIPDHILNPVTFE